jgi:hypothetical protein
VFSQYGEIIDVNLVRAEDTGKSRGFAFICYEDQRSTVLAVDNLNGAKVVGRTIKVEHVEDYRLKDEEAAKRKDWKCGCGAENFKFRDICFKCGGPRPLPEGEAGEDQETREFVGKRSTDGVVGAEGRRIFEGLKHDDRVAEDERPAMEEGVRAARKAEAWEGAAFKAISQTDEEDEMIKALKARKEAAIARAKAAAAGLPIPGGDDALREAKKEAKCARKERKAAKKAKKDKKEAKELDKRAKEGFHNDRKDYYDDGLGSSSGSEEEGAIPSATARDGYRIQAPKDGQRRLSRSRSRSRSDVGYKRRRSRSLDEHDDTSGQLDHNQARDRYDARSAQVGRDRSCGRYDDRCQQRARDRSRDI